MHCTCYTGKLHCNYIAITLEDGATLHALHDKITLENGATLHALHSEIALYSAIALYCNTRATIHALDSIRFTAITHNARATMDALHKDTTFDDF